MKKILILVIVLCFVVFLGVSFNSCGDSGRSSAPLEEGTPSSAETTLSPADAEQIPVEAEETIEETNDEGPLLDESGQEIPVVTFSDEFVIELEENQGTGGF